MIVLFIINNLKEKKVGVTRSEKNLQTVVSPHPPFHFSDFFFFFTEKLSVNCNLMFQTVNSFFSRFSKTVLCYNINGNEPIKH